MEKLIELINEYVINQEINNDTRIYQDLNIYGDDAYEFLEKYSKAFKVKFIDFNFSEYFPNEGDLLITKLIRILRKERVHHKELTIGNLMEGISTGTLDFNQIAST